MWRVQLELTPEAHMSTTSPTMPRTRRAAIAATLCCAAVLGSASAANAGVSPITLGAATLVARGAAVSVAITASCSGSAEGSDGYAVATITQRQGNRTVTGFAGGGPQQGLICDGTLRTVALTVTPDNGGAFKTGEAWIDAGVSIFTETESVSSSIAQVVRIHR
jgi:hypothetical protein